MKAVTDEQLIQWVADGDPSCLAALFDRHHHAVYHYLLQMLKEQALCEDLVQDVFLKVLRKAQHFRGEGSFKGWLFNIARNVALDELRKANRQGTDPLDDCETASALTDHRSAEQEAAGKQKVKLVLQAMAKLPAAVQEVIWLGRFEFDSYEELGQALNCNAGTARVRMHRAMDLLKSTYISMHGVPVDG
ncbi:MAG: sigma-70 family RNA polymerase sigma factor [Woeseiaceae bacterium]|nr:sigma-70 family RNA polymerase sigma factor [Woeseiaceae bacterium]